MSKVSSTIRRLIGEQRGSYVAQTAGIALFVTVVITLLFSAMPGMRASVQSLLECEIAKYSGGRGCGAGGGATNGPGPDWRDDPTSPLYQNQPIQPQPTAAPATAAPRNEPVPVSNTQPARRCEQGLLAGTFGGGGSIPLSRMPTTSNCDARCQFLGLLDGFGEGFWSMLRGLGQLGMDLWRLATGDQATWAKYEQLVQAIMQDPVAVARELLGALGEPIVADWNAGCYGRATGRLLFEVLASLEGPKGLDKLARLGLLDKLGDAGRVLRRLPCVAAAPTDKVPGLAKPTFSCKWSVAPKVQKQMPKRGWNAPDVDDVLDKPADIAKTTDVRHNPTTGTRNSDPATIYYRSDGHYVVRNDRTLEIIQISDRSDPNWIDPFGNPIRPRP